MSEYFTFAATNARIQAQGLGHLSGVVVGRCRMAYE